MHAESTKEESKEYVNDLVDPAELRLLVVIRGRGCGIRLRSGGVRLSRPLIRLSRKWILLVLLLPPLRVRFKSAH